MARLQPGEIAWVLALPQLARSFAPAAWGWLADRSGAQRGIVAFSCAAMAAGFACFRTQKASCRSAG